MSKYENYYLEMGDQFNELAQLFLQKNEKQYANQETNPLINFEAGAEFLFNEKDLPAMFNAAKCYMAKHLAYLKKADIDSCKIDESLFDIANYCLIMRYMVNERRKTKQNESSAPTL